MRKLTLNSILILALSAVLTGCHGNPHETGAGSSGGGGTVTTTTPVDLLLTDSPPSGITPLSFEVTLQSAELEPGNVSLLLAPQNEEITRLQTETAMLSTTEVAVGSYTSVQITYANPSLTFENNTGASIVAGGITCTAGSVCTISPTATNQTTTLTFPSALAVSVSAPQAVQLDLNLANLFSSALAADFTAGSSVTAVSPSSADLLGAVEDYVGQVEAVSTANSTVTIGNSLSALTAYVNSATAYLDFPTGTCPTPAFSCLADAQIVSADVSVQPNGTLLAEHIYFKDANSSETEVEGVITAINLVTQQFTYVVLNESATVAGLGIGSIATAHWNVAPVTTTFAPDDMGLDTTGYLFAIPADLMVGQEVSVLRNTSSAGLSLNADRVLLRGSRITAAVSGGTSFPNLTLTALPSFFGAAGTSQLTVTVSTTLGQTEYSGNATVFSEIGPGAIVSVRGQLFPNAGTPTVLASKVVLN
jgi:hypothetical protein